MKQLSFLSIFLVFCFQVVCAEKPHAILAQLYTNITGFTITDGERSLINEAGGNPTYGEILPQSVSILLKDLKLTEKDVFYDLGSGVGKVAVQVYFESAVKKSVGVELSPTRHAHAIGVYEKLQKSNKLQPGKDLVFRMENILHTDITDATVIFLCSTCYSEELMKGLSNKIQKLKPGTRVLTLKEFKKPSSLKFIKTYQLGMTWSASNSVHLYEVV